MSVPSLPRRLDAFVSLVGRKTWDRRLAWIREQAGGGRRAGLAIRERHAAELAIARMRGPGARAPSAAEAHLADLASQAVTLHRTLSPEAQVRLVTQIEAGLTGDGTLIPLLHLLRTASLQASRGFRVRFSGLEDGAPFDLLLDRDSSQAEVACEVVSAEHGRGVHRGAWFRLADLVDPDLQTWLAAHPGRYLLKMTLPQGCRAGWVPIRRRLPNCTGASADCSNRSGGRTTTRQWCFVSTRCCSARRRRTSWG